jgi:hypothetical protein
MDRARKRLRANAASFPFVPAYFVGVVVVPAPVELPAPVVPVVDEPLAAPAPLLCVEGVDIEDEVEGDTVPDALPVAEPIPDAEPVVEPVPAQAVMARTQATGKSTFIMIQVLFSTGG